MTREQIEALGFDIETVSCYDEEGVEGWKVTAPSGAELVELGAWDEEPPFTIEDLESLRGQE